MELNLYPRFFPAWLLTFNIFITLSGGFFKINNVFFNFFLQFRTHKVIYRRYAGLFFSLCVDITDNELAYLECIHLFVEILDHFFSNVCELDLVFNFHKVCSSIICFFFVPDALFFFHWLIYCCGDIYAANYIVVFFCSSICYGIAASHLSFWMN